MKRRYFVLDIEKCIGCFNCLHACKDEHVNNDWSPVALPQMLHHEYWLTTTEHVRGQHPMVDVAYLTEPCNHCEHAPCVANGKGAVYRRDDGVVLIDPQRAKALGDISNACPYGKITYNWERGVSQKCTFCAHLLDDGWEEPRCVQACPVPGALASRYCEPEEMDAEVESDGLSLAHPDLAYTGPSVYYRNLYRVNAVFLGGSVAREESGRETCFAGCLVKLTQDGNEIARQQTDAYGEFKFDRLRPGRYTITVDSEGFEPLAFVVDLAASLYVGVLRPVKGR